MVGLRTLIVIMWTRTDDETDLRVSSGSRLLDGLVRVLDGLLDIQPVEIYFVRCTILFEYPLSAEPNDGRLISRTLLFSLIVELVQDLMSSKEGRVSHNKDLSLNKVR